MASYETKTLTLPSTNNTIFYRTAGDPTNPVLLLLHGFPSSSHQFRNLIPLLSASYYILAPDLPGFGFTTVPASFNYTFASIASTISSFLTALNIAKYAVYIFDYGAPTAFRLALENPHAITAIITQNGNAYTDGLNPAFWGPLQKWWAHPTTAQRAELQNQLLAFDTTKSQYTTGVPADELGRIQPEAYWLDQALLERPGNSEVQMQLFWDYQNNVKLYPDFQRWLRESKVPVLAVWGKGDVIFPPAGAEAYKRDVKDVEVVLVDGGHFLLETRGGEVAERVRGFLGRVLGK